MPTSTARYRFEFALFDWAEHFVRDLTGDRRSFFIGMREDGSIRRVYFSREDEGFDGPKKSALADSHSIWFLYSPYDSEGSGYLEWFGLSHRAAQHWLKRRLDEDDFNDVRSKGSREGWPESWRVIIS